MGQMFTIKDKHGFTYPTLEFNWACVFLFAKSSHPKSLHNCPKLRSVLPQRQACQAVPPHSIPAPLQALPLLVCGATVLSGFP